MQVAIIGSTGQVGKHVCSELLQKEDVTQLLSISRKQVDITDRRFKGVYWNFSGVEQWPAEQVDVAMSCLGTTIQKAGSQAQFMKVDHDYVLDYAKWAKRNGAREFHLVSALGADPNSKVFYNRVKGRLEDELTALGFETLLIYRPAILDSDRDERRVWERMAVLLMRRINPLLKGRFKNFRSIRVEAVAQGMVGRMGTLKGKHVIPSHEI